VSGEAAHFERLSLEAFQSGLSWRTILLKRPAFRAAFADFDPEVVAAYDDTDVARLMADAGIVRNRRKVEATIANARATVRCATRAAWRASSGAFAPEAGPPPRVVVTSRRPRPSPWRCPGAQEGRFRPRRPTTMYASWRPSAWSTTTSRTATVGGRRS
jgi:DNA-3-methyladenine glycosylase I